MTQVTGKAFITVKGKRRASREGATLKFGGGKRQAEMADSGVVGFSEGNGIPEVEFTLVHTAETSLAELQSMTNETVSFDTDTGKSYVISNAWCTGDLELSKGEVKVKMQGLSCKEL